MALCECDGWDFVLPDFFRVSCCDEFSGQDKFSTRYHSFLANFWKELVQNNIQSIFAVQIKS